MKCLHSKHKKELHNNVEDSCLKKFHRDHFTKEFHLKKKMSKDIFRFCLEEEGRGEIQTMFTHVSKCKNNIIKGEKKAIETSQSVEHKQKFKGNEQSLRNLWSTIA
jgi:hypothetical protein